MYVYSRLLVATDHTHLFPLQMFSKQAKTKGVSDLIEIENPNRVQAKTKKVKDVDVNVKVELSRRER